MDFEGIKNQKMFVLVAPDGSWQGMTLSPDFPTCVSVIKMMHKAGLCQSFHVLCKEKGFKILPVLVTMAQAGGEDTAFNDMKLVKE